MSDDELFDLYLKDNENIITSLWAVYNKGVKDGKAETAKDKNELIIHIMHGYDTIETEDGVKCFGCYVKGQYEIYVASDIPDGQLFHAIAHEYCHYLQDISGREFDEDEANEYADNVLNYKNNIHTDNSSLVEEIRKLIQEENNKES